LELRSVAALVSQILQLPQQAVAGQAGIGLYPLAQIAGERVQQRRPRPAQPIDRRLKPTLDNAANRLAVEPALPDDRRQTCFFGLFG
jgi:hypothetical protein